MSNDRPVYLHVQCIVGFHGGCGSPRDYNSCKAPGLASVFQGSVSIDQSTVYSSVFATLTVNQSFCILHVPGSFHSNQCSVSRTVEIIYKLLH